MKIAQYDIGGGTLGIRNAELEQYMGDCARVSEYLEVEFTPRAQDELIPEQIAIIDKETVRVDREYTRAILELKARKANLLALTDQRTIKESA